MQSVERHSFEPDASFDGGDLDCGNGLLLLIRQHMDPLERGGLLEFRSTEISVEADFPAWCRMTGNELVSWTKHGKLRSFLVCKGALADRRERRSTARSPAVLGLKVVPVSIPKTLPSPAPAPAIPALAVMGVGSWPRPRWMLHAIHEHLEGRLSDADFRETAADATRLAVQAQLRAGVDVVTDGEQRRDNYASFVGGLLDNCRLIPLTDLLPLVDHPEEFEREMRSLDVPASEVRHPAVFGPLGRSGPLARDELELVRTLTDRPVKIALPGPYLLAAGVALVQLDEPVLSEVVFTGAKNTRSFMCGALSEKGDSQKELELARTLINQVVAGLPAARLGLHVCRGNWTPDERVALAGDYRPLLGLLRRVNVGTLFLELATPRAGGMEMLADLPDDLRIGVGVVNQKRREVEEVEDVLARGRRAIDILGAERVLLTPDCGFATFADNPVASPQIAAAKLRVIVAAAERLRTA